MSLKISFTLLFTLILFTMLYLSTYAQQTATLSNVVRVESSNCKHKPYTRAQTGFFVKDKGNEGIVTALHGVVDCADIVVKTNIVAQEESGLKIKLVDIDRDVALLTTTLAMNSVNIAINPALKAGDTLQIEGYPENLTFSLLSRQLILSKIAPLKEFLPADDAITKPLDTRNSPNLDIEVMGIEGTLLPGHSGAPIFNQAKQLVGVGDGGLESGQVGIGWAIPWSQIQWVSASTVRDGLDKLGANSPEQLFSFSSPDKKEYVKKESCLSTIGTTYNSLDNLKDALLIKAQKEAVAELFGELLVSYSSAEKDKILTSSANFIRIDGTPVYTDYPEILADACVTINGYITANDRSQLEPQEVEGTFCDKNIPDEVEKQAIMKALANIDLRLESRPDLSYLLRNREFIDSGTEPKTKNYCTTARGEVRPIEVRLLLGNSTLSPAPTTMTPITVPTNAPSVGYPCDATIKGGGLVTQLNLRRLPNGTTNGMSVKVNQTVKIASQMDGWYEIRDMQNNQLGWLSNENLTQSANCPQ